MSSKWDRVRGSFQRAHTDFAFPTVEFQAYRSTGVTNGNVTGEYARVAELDCEFVPPRDDSTVDTEGTHLDFTTSIRVPAPDIATLRQDKTISDGDTLTIPSEETWGYGTLTVESGGTVVIDGTLLVDTVDNDGTINNNGTLSTGVTLPLGIVEYGDDNQRPTKVIAEGVGYEVQAVIPEHGSNMRLIRLTED